MIAPVTSLERDFQRDEAEIRSVDIPRNLLTRVGCRCLYDVAAEAVMLLNLRPRSSARQRVQAETLALENCRLVDRFYDAHENLIERLTLKQGRCEIRHDAIVEITDLPDNALLDSSAPIPLDRLPTNLYRYVLPSRYCESDRLLNFAWEKFGQIENGLPRVQAICDWIHSNIEYRFGSGRPDLSAWEVVQRGYGVCRDFAHTAIALSRTFNLPARYVTGHLPDIGYVDPGTPMDFHAYLEVYLGGCWYTFDPRYNVPRIGRIKISCGRDAVDGAFATISGAVQLAYFEVWAYQVSANDATLREPVDLSKRLDGALEVRRA